jgi:hypothetical protein
VHLLKMLVTDENDNKKEYSHQFSFKREDIIDYHIKKWKEISIRNFKDLFGRFILFTKFNFFFKIFHLVNFVLFLYIFADYLFYFKLTNHFFYLFYCLYFEIGVWFVGEVQDGIFGLVFLRGVYLLSVNEWFVSTDTYLAYCIWFLFFSFIPSLIFNYFLKLSKNSFWNYFLKILLFAFIVKRCLDFHLMVRYYGVFMYFSPCGFLFYLSFLYLSLK